MAYLPEDLATVDTENEAFTEPVYQYETDDVIEGGPDGMDNIQTKNLVKRTVYLLKELFKKAPINSPTFTGSPKAPTQSANDESTKIATTQFVKQAIDDHQSFGNSGQEYTSHPDKAVINTNFFNTGSHTIQVAVISTVNAGQSLSINVNGDVIDAVGNAATVATGKTVKAFVTPGSYWSIGLSSGAVQHVRIFG